MANKQLEHDITREINKAMCIFEILESKYTDSDVVQDKCFSDAKIALDKILESFEEYKEDKKEVLTSRDKKIRLKKSDGIVLIDDDKEILHQWKLATEKNKVSFTGFSSFNDFLKEVKNINNKTLIVLDSQIDGESLTGQEVGQFIFKEFGMKNLVLQTGFSKSLFNDYEKYFLLIRENKIFSSLNGIEQEINNKG